MTNEEYLRKTQDILDHLHTIWESPEAANSLEHIYTRIQKLRDEEPNQDLRVVMELYQRVCKIYTKKD